MAKVRRRFVRCEAPSCGQGKGVGGAPRMNPCVNAFLTAYLAAPLRGVGFAVFVRLWGVYGRFRGGCRGGGVRYFRGGCPVGRSRERGETEGATKGARKL